MRKLLIVLAIVLMAVPALAQVDTILQKFPATKTGIMWDMTKDANDLIAVEMIELASYEGISANAGISTKVNDQAKGILTGSVNYNLGALTKYGVNVPYGNSIELGVGFGRDFDNKDWKVGPVAVYKMKF